MGCVVAAALLVACEPPRGSGMPEYVLPTATSGEIVAPSPTVSPTAADVMTETMTPLPETMVAGDNDDWESLVKRALQAQNLFVYSDSARALTSLANMAVAYPGLDATGRVMSGPELCAAVAEGGATHQRQADLVLTSGAACLQALVNAGELTPYLPATLLPTLSEDMLEPVLTHHWEVLGLHQNDRLGEEQVLLSWWDLVSPAWRGAVALADPLVDEHAQGFLDALIAHEPELRASYRGQMGDEALADAPAWAVWLRGVAANDLRILPSDAEVARWVGDLAAEEGRAGICSSVHWERVSRGDLRLRLVQDAMPTAGVRWRTFVAPAADAANADGAKLGLLWLMGDETGRGGYEPWYQAGLYPARLDVPLAAGTVPRSELVGRLWEVPLTPDTALRAEAVELLAAARGE